MKLLTITLLVALAAVAIASKNGEHGEHGGKGKGTTTNGPNYKTVVYGTRGILNTLGTLGTLGTPVPKGYNTIAPDGMGGKKGEHGEHGEKGEHGEHGEKGEKGKGKGKGAMMSEATLSTGGSAFAGVGAIALVAGVGFVAVRKYRSRSGYNTVDAPLDSIAIEQQSPLMA